MLWVTLLLASVLGVGRLWASERDGGTLDGLLLAPVDRTALWAAKALALLLYLALLELVAVPAFAVLLLGPELGPVLPPLAALLRWPISRWPPWGRWWEGSRRRAGHAS